MQQTTEGDGGLADPLLSSSTGGSGATSSPQTSFRKLARNVVMAQRVVKRNMSSKGVPLLQSESLLSMFGGVGGLEDEDESSSTARTFRPQTMSLAAQFISDALAGRSPNTRLASTVGVAGLSSLPPSSVLEQIIHHWVYSGILQLIVTLHCILAFFEPTPPATAAPPFSWSVGCCEICFILVYCLDVAFVLRAMGWRHFLDKRWESVFALIATLAVFDWLLYYPVGLRGMWRFSRPFRPLLGVAKVKSLRRLLSSIIWTIPALVDMSLLLFVAIFFYAALGVQLFNRGQVPGYSAGNDHFDDMTSASLAIYILTTTENYPNVGERIFALLPSPDVMLVAADSASAPPTPPSSPLDYVAANPAYHHRPYAAGIFFVTALFCTLWLALPLVLARVYSHYKEVHTQMSRAKRVKQYTSLVFAYQTVMGGDGDQEMDRSMFRQLVCTCNPSLRERQADLMFDVLDIDRSGAITIAEFLRLPAVLALRFPQEYNEDMDEVLLPTTHANDFDLLWARTYRWCRHAASSKWFAIIAGIVIVLSCISGSLWTTDGQRSYDACLCISYSQPNDDDPASPPSSGADWSDGAGCTPGANCSNYLVHVADVLGLVFSLGQVRVRSDVLFKPRSIPLGFRGTSGPGCFYVRAPHSHFRGAGR
jgi:hypothetical protein